ncbi:phospholipid scramblase 2-like [Convolutriloba macropyga]|uniref:phospholipid scramblase 2-like n=1 Tax=Convolutriloba macropyga TaxID=536237 RepID=UPI003F51CD6C
MDRTGLLSEEMSEKPPADPSEVGFVQPGQPGYPPPGTQPGYPPPQGQPGYPPPQGQPGYPPQGQPGYGYPPPQQGAQPAEMEAPPGQPPAPPNMQGAAPGGWMQPPQAMGAGQPEMASNVPPGLEYLTFLDQVLVQQVVELLEAFTGWETDNKYAIKNMMGQQCYYAFEESGCCAKQCCKNRRGFVMKIVDNTQREVIRAQRPFKCCATTCCWCPCCGCSQHEIVVESPPGIVIGRIHNELVIYLLDYLKIINSASTGEEVGQLKKQFTGMVKEVFTDADNYSVSFPKDLDVRAKALLMCATFLIDFLFYEDNQEKDKAEL